MVTLRIKDLLKSHYTNGDGEKLNEIILHEFRNDNSVRVSFDGITEVNSSFVKRLFSRRISPKRVSFSCSS